MNQTLPLASYKDYGGLMALKRTRSYHFKEHCSSDGHPVQLDLKGSVEGEVAVVIAAAPLGSVTAVVDVHVESDRLLLWNCSSYRTRGQGWETGRRETKQQRKGG